MPTALHLWNEFFPGQFPDVRFALPKQNRWSIKVVAARGTDLENPTPDMPEVLPFTRQTRNQWRHPSRTTQLFRRVTQRAFWNRFNSYCSRAIRREQAGIVHAHFGTTAARLLPALARSSVPAVASFYGVDASAIIKDPRWLPRYRQLFSRFSRLIVLCEAVQQRFLALGCPETKLRIWNLPAGVEHYPYREPAPVDVVRFIIAARFIEKKGHRFLLEAFRQLIASGRKASLTILGYGSAEDSALLEERVRSHQLQEHVRIVDTDSRNDFNVVYNHALSNHDIFVLPSTTAANGDDEAGPALTLVYAQAAGLPVICTPFPGSEITVTDSVTGLYCRQDDPDSLHAQMAHLADHRDVWRKIGRAGSEIAHREFSTPHLMEKLLEMYEELL